MNTFLKDYLKKTWFKLIVLAIMVFIHIYLTTLPPKIVGIIVDIISNSQIDFVEFYKMIINLIISSFLVLSIRVPWRGLSGYIILDYERTLKDRLFKHFMKIKMENIQEIKNGEIMTYFTKDVNDTRRFLGSIVAFGIRILATFIIATYIMMTRVNFKLTLITLSPMMITIILLIIVKGKIQKASLNSRNAFSNLSEYVQESTDGIRTIKAYAGEEEQIDEFVNRNRLLKNAESKVGILSAVLATVVNIGFGLCIGVSILYGSNLVLNNKISIGDLIAFNGYILMFVNPVMWIPMIITRFKTYQISKKRLDYIFDLEEEKISNFDSKKGKISGDIIINNLTYNYPSNIEIALKNIDLEIKEGQTLGIIGTIGSGKTTLMNLLVGLYQVPDGKISIGGIDINKIDINDLRNSICYITQDQFLFSTSIKDNISLFRNDYTNEEIENSTNNAMISDEIKQMEKGIETIVGEKGIDLSGGQKQRVSISRAFLEKSNFVIFDDTFSALDNKTEEFLLNNIRDLTKEKTCIIISNRISDIKDADNIIVLDDGEIIQSGNHKKLVKEDGLYRKFYYQQSSKDYLKVGELID